MRYYKSNLQHYHQTGKDILKCVIRISWRKILSQSLRCIQSSIAENCLQLQLRSFGGSAQNFVAKNPFTFLNAQLGVFTVLTVLALILLYGGHCFSVRLPSNQSGATHPFAKVILHLNQKLGTERIGMVRHGTLKNCSINRHSSELYRAVLCHTRPHQQGEPAQYGTVPADQCKHT